MSSMPVFITVVSMEVQKFVAKLLHLAIDISSIGLVYILE